MWPGDLFESRSEGISMVVAFFFLLNKPDAPDVLIPLPCFWRDSHQPGAQRGIYSLQPFELTSCAW